MVINNNILINFTATIEKDAKEGIYKAIGDGLRMHPEMLVSSDESMVGKVLNGTSAYIRVRF